jgi:4-hydroxyphenylpyruvate dioxygenase
MSVLGFSHLELWVHDAAVTASLFRNRFGFSLVGRTEELGTDGRPVAYELRQGDIVIFVRSASAGRPEVAEFVERHGDGVRDLAFLDDDPAATYQHALAAGAEPGFGGRDGPMPSVIKGFGHAVHSLVEERGTSHASSVDMSSLDGPSDDDGPKVGLVSIDHCAVSVEAGRREHWSRFYSEALGLARIPGDRTVDVDGSAFTMSTVQVRGADPALVLAEPTVSSRKSQIADFLEHFKGAGVHHIALSTNDIAVTVSALNERGMQMLDAPATYLETSEARMEGLDIGVDWRDLARLGILIDTDEDGYLLQAFTPPMGDRPTTCLEIIQREGTRGFGAHNVRDLYSQVVQEQHRREVNQA